MSHVKRNPASREIEEPRKPFVAPRLKQHEKLPEMTAASGDICDIFPDAPGCQD